MEYSSVLLKFGFGRIVESFPLLLFVLLGFLNFRIFTRHKLSTHGLANIDLLNLVKPYKYYYYFTIHVYIMINGTLPMRVLITCSEKKKLWVS